VQHRFDRAEPGFDQRPLGASRAARRVGVLTPFEPGIREIGLAVPDALIDQRLQPGAVSPRL
jgi:hypothetical protein